MLIKTNNLRKEYESVIAVKDLNLEIPKGAIFGLIGPNGAGKTTTFRMITGLLEPTSGSTIIENIDVWRDPLLAFSKIGYLPDFFSLYEKLKVWEYLDFFANAYKLNKSEIPDKINEMLDIVNLTDKKHEFVYALSRGMKQRLAIAKTIIHDPELIILDEPASGLDPLARKDLMQTILKLNKLGKTILISSHILTELEEVCTYIGIMENGVLVKSGEIKNIVETDLSTRKIEIELIGKNDELIAYLKNFKTVSNISNTPQGLVFDLKGNDEKVVAFHKQLMTKNFPIVSFVHKKKNITDVFIEVSKKTNNNIQTIKNNIIK